MIRKIVILFTLVGLFSGRIYAQLNVPQESQKLEKIDYIQKVEKYRKMRRAGSVLTVVGSILVVAGVATAAVSFVDSDGSAVNAGAGWPSQDMHVSLPEFLCGLLVELNTRNILRNFRSFP